MNDIIDYTGLTPTQEKILRFIVYGILQGLTPSMREICEAFDFKSPNGAMTHIKALVRKGKLRPVGHKARSLFPTGVKLVMVKDEPPPQPLEATNA